MSTQRMTGINGAPEPLFRFQALVQGVPSGLAPDPDRRHRSALASGVVVRRRRAYRGGRRPSGHRSPVAEPRARAPCAGWLVGRNRAPRRGPGRSGRRWCEFGSLASAGSALLPPGDLAPNGCLSTLKYSVRGHRRRPLRIPAKASRHFGFFHISDAHVNDVDLR